MSRQNRNLYSAPGLDEQVGVIQSMIDGLRVAFTQLNDNGSGELTDPDALREIECLEATRQMLLLAKATSSSTSGITGASFSNN